MIFRLSAENGPSSQQKRKEEGSRLPAFPGQETRSWMVPAVVCQGQRPWDGRDPGVPPGEGAGADSSASEHFWVAFRYIFVNIKQKKKK